MIKVAEMRRARASIGGIGVGTVRKGYVVRYLVARNDAEPAADQEFSGVARDS